MNIPPSIMAKVGQNLHLRKDHPICTMKNLVARQFTGFELMDDISPLCSVEDNFDSLLIPQDHSSRNSSDTYYATPTTVLRTHTSAHQVEALKSGRRQFLIAGDVYRKDEIDATHYPVFHQIEGVKIMDGSTHKDVVIEDMMRHINKALWALFPNMDASGPLWKPDYFPFTNPSWEVSVGDLEVLGCGVIQPKVLANASLEGVTGWAFGMGLERLAMRMFSVPDIRLFWSQDERFTSQFKDGEISTFKPFSKHPSCYKDISIWVPQSWNKNEFHEVVRNVAGDLAEEVKEIDSYNKGGRISKCYRIVFRSMERTLENEEIDELQARIRESVTGLTGVELR